MTQYCILYVFMYRSLKRTCGRQRIATLVQAGILEKANELRMAEKRLQKVMSTNINKI